MKIQYSKAAAKTLAAMDSKTKQRIKDAIEAIPAGDIKPLQGRDGYYRLRVGGWRVIFEYDGKTIGVVKIAPRGEAYKGGF